MELIPIYVTPSGNRAFNPSPDSYQPQKPFGGDVPRLRIHDRLPAERSERFPPPGAYNPIFPLGSSDKGRIGGLSKRSPYDIRKTPAPNTYDTSGTLLPNPIRIGSPSRSEKIGNNPPPGSYQPDPPFGSTQSGGRILGQSERSPYTINTTPSPATYDASGKSLPNPIRLGSPSRQERIPVSPGPGPGTYDADPRFGSTQRGGHILGQSARSPYNLPSPPSSGERPPSHRSSRRSTAISFSRGSERSRATPPPSSCHSPRSSRSRGQIRERASQSASQPSMYIPPPFGSDGAHIAISPRRESRSRILNGPPPGAYDTGRPFGSDARGVRLGASARGSYSSGQRRPMTSYQPRTTIFYR